jgi:hypothetical protein
MTTPPLISIAFVPSEEHLRTFAGRGSVMVVPMSLPAERDLLGNGIGALFRHVDAIRRACATLAELNETRPATRDDIARTLALIGGASEAARSILDDAAQIIGRGVFVSLSEPKGRVQ